MNGHDIRMLPGMRREYVCRRSELTERIDHEPGLFIAEIQPFLAYLKEIQLPAVIVINVTNNSQSIGNVTNSTISGCNTVAPVERMVRYEQS
jgi:hypothetical protein